MATNTDKLISKLREVARVTLGNSRDGVCFVNFTMFLDRRGEPLIWWVEKSCRVEPSSDAKRVLYRVLTNSIEQDALDND